MPLYVFLIIYFIGIGIFLMWTFFNLYHIIKFGFFDFTGKLNTAIFAMFSIIILVVTVLLLRETPWLDTIDIFDFLSLDLFRTSNPLNI